MTVAVVLLGLAVALLAALVISLLRSHAEILRVLHEMGIDLDPATSARALASGTSTTPLTDADTVAGVPGPADALGRPAVDLVGVTPNGDAAAVGMGAAHTLLAFLTSGCATCLRFWTAFAEQEALVDGRLSDGTRVVVVTRGEDAESPAAVAELASDDITVVMSSDAWEDYGVPVAPYFALVQHGEVVGEGAAASWAQVGTLLQRARADATSIGDDRTPASAARSRRSLITGNRDRIDADLVAAGIHPGDPRLHHRPTDVGMDVGSPSPAVGAPGDGEPGDGDAP